MEIYVKFLWLPYFLLFDFVFIIHADLTRNAAWNTVNDDVTG